MQSEESHVYRRIISEQITLQELQQREGNSSDPLGVTRRIKRQRRLLSQLRSTVHDLGKLTPLV